MEVWPADAPEHQRQYRRKEYVRMPNHLSGAAGEAAKPEVDPAGLFDLFTGLDIRFAVLICHGFYLDESF
jgi:hypothetical protein